MTGRSEPLEFVDTICQILERTPRIIRLLLEGLPDELTAADYGPDTWSAKMVVGHLIHGERTDWLPRIRQILSSADAEPFPPFDRRGHEPMCRRESLDSLLAIFPCERSDRLAELRSLQLSAEDLKRPGVHPALGPVTLGELLATWAVHDLNHLAQVCKAVAGQYREQVGPWSEYISILAPPNPR